MKYYITVDIGGTNVSMGLMNVSISHDTPSFTLQETQSHKSQEHENLIILLKEFISHITNKYSIVSTPPINISSCGPTDGQSCQPTNLPKTWHLNRHELEKIFQTKIFLINDFAAIAYSLMTLSKNDERITAISGSPEPLATSASAITKLVLGAGTGLGCSTVQSDSNNRVSLLPSEAGWLDFAPDYTNPYEISYALFLSHTKDIPAQLPAYSWEDAICASRGFNNIYSFFCNEQYSKDIITPEERTYLIQTFGNDSLHDRPANISKAGHAHSKPCMDIIKFWVVLYARCARQYALMTLPQGGVFLGGGAASKNIQFFQENNLFYNAFSKHNNKEIKKLVETLPVYVITEYLISLYGNAFHLYTQIDQ